MAKVLVVANRTLGGAQLFDLLRQRVQAGDCSVHMLVPAGPDPHGWTSSDGEERTAAQQRLESALQRFSRLGCQVTGEIGDARPVDAVGDVLRREPFDEVIVSTLPVGVSRWLRADLVSRLTRSLDVPVTHVVGAEEPTSV